MDSLDRREFLATTAFAAGAKAASTEPMSIEERLAAGLLTEEEHWV